MQQTPLRVGAAVLILVALSAAGAVPAQSAPLDPAPRPAPAAPSLPVGPDPETTPMPRPEAAESGRLDPGWTLRAASGGERVALADGPGRVADIAAFCLAGAPWLTLDLEPAPEAERVRVDFGFSGGRVEADALREAGAGGAYVIELAEGPLAGLLAGGDAQATLGIDGTQQGFLSLAGSSRAIRAALEDCHAF